MAALSGEQCEWTGNVLLLSGGCYRHSEVHLQDYTPRFTHQELICPLKNSFVVKVILFRPGSAWFRICHCGDAGLASVSLQAREAGALACRVVLSVMGLVTATSW